MINRSKHIYKISAKRGKSQFEQKRQVMRCRVLEAHRGFILVESMKRYDKKLYKGANVAKKGQLKGIPVRRINIDQIGEIIDELTGKTITFNTIRRREGTNNSPGRARGGK